MDTATDWYGNFRFLNKPISLYTVSPVTDSEAVACLEEFVFLEVVLYILYQGSQET